MRTGVNGNNQWEWEGNGNKTRLNLGLGMGINHWEWEGMGLKKIFPLISTSEVVSQCHSEVECIFPDDGQMCDCGGSMHVDNVASMIDRARRNGYCAPTFHLSMYCVTRPTTCYSAWLSACPMCYIPSAAMHCITKLQSPKMHAFIAITWSFHTPVRQKFHHSYAV